MHLSVVIPIYNEATRLAPSLEKIIAYFADQSYTREIVLVDDGSSDNGLELAKALLEGRETYRIISYGSNRGKGYALRQGIIASQGDFVLFSDADLSTPIEELDKFWPWLEAGFEIVQGSRKMPGAMVERRQPWLRQKMGEVYTWLSGLLLVPGITDVTCGFKSYRGEVARELYALQRLPRWAFDSEILFLAHKHGYRVKECAVRWHDERGTKVRLLRDALNSLREIGLIRLNNWRGYYNSPAPVESLKSKA